MMGRASSRLVPHHNAADGSATVIKGLQQERPETGADVAKQLESIKYLILAMEHIASARTADWTVHRSKTDPVAFSFSGRVCIRSGRVRDLHQEQQPVHPK